METREERLQASLIGIASELFRFTRVFEKAVSRLDYEERNRYYSQFSWFSKRVLKAMDEAGLKLINLEGQLYDPGMAVTPLNIEEFEEEDGLYVAQMLEPVVMKEGTLIKMGTALLGRIE